MGEACCSWHEVIVIGGRMLMFGLIGFGIVYAWEMTC